MKKLLLLIGILTLLGCSKPPEEYATLTVVSIGDCTEGTGGWGGMMARCRVTYDTGEKGTLMRPVDIGDVVECPASRINEYNCNVL